LTGVKKAVVQAAGTALPEFEVAGDDAVAAPKGGKRHLAIAEFALHFLPFLFEKGTGGDDGALRGDPGAELVAARAGDEIGEGSALETFSAAPQMMTWRSKASQGKRRETLGFSAIWRALRLSRLVKKTKPRSS